LHQSGIGIALGFAAFLTRIGGIQSNSLILFI
jgi:hypothetical protein